MSVCLGVANDMTEILTKMKNDQQKIIADQCKEISKLKDMIEEMKFFLSSEDKLVSFEKIKGLEADLFNEKEHYKCLKQNYDDVFKFIDAKYGITFNDFMKWLVEKGSEVESEEVTWND